MAASGVTNYASNKTGKTLRSAAISVSATGTIVAAVAGRCIKVYSVLLVCDSALVVNWRDGASTALEGAQSFAANSGYSRTLTPPSYLFKTTAGNVLALVITGTGNVRGQVCYWTDDDA